MRLTSVCTTASTEPTTRLSTASAQMTGCQSTCELPNAEYATRRSAAKPAALAAAAMNPVTGVGEPWYTSGVHMWNGTAATLKPSPTASIASAASSMPELTTFVRRNAEIAVRFVDPVTP